MKQVIALALLMLATQIMSSPAYCNFVINFDDLNLNNGAAIPQTYGDNALFDVSYRELDQFGNAGVAQSNLSFWTSNYGDLQNVIWGSDQITSRVAEIRFESLSANPISLISFDAADWDGTAASQRFRVYDQNYSLLFELANFDVTDLTRDTIVPNVSSNTLILQWDYPWGVAVDNISISAVPEPNALALVGLCTACYAIQRRRITKR